KPGPGWARCSTAALRGAGSRTSEGKNETPEGAPRGRAWRIRSRTQPGSKRTTSQAATVGARPRATSEAAQGDSQVRLAAPSPSPWLMTSVTAGTRRQGDKETSRGGDKENGPALGTAQRPAPCLLVSLSPCLVSGLRGGRHRLDLQLPAHPVDELVDLEGLVQEVVGPRQAQLLDLVLLDHAADAEDADVLQGRVGADAVAHLLAVDVREHDVQDDQVGAVLLDHHAAVEAGGGDADLEAAVPFQDLGHHLDQIDVVIDEQHLALAALQGVGRDAVVLHELVEHLARDAAEARAGHAEPLELP